MTPTLWPRNSNEGPIHPRHGAWPEKFIYVTSAGHAGTCQVTPRPVCRQAFCLAVAISAIVAVQHDHNPPTAEHPKCAFPTRLMLAHKCKASAVFAAYCSPFSCRSCVQARAFCASVPRCSGSGNFCDCPLDPRIGTGRFDTGRRKRICCRRDHRPRHDPVQECQPFIAAFGIERRNPAKDFIRVRNYRAQNNVAKPIGLNPR